MKRSFAIYLLAFFIPVVLGVVVMEYLARDLEANYKYISERIESHGDEIEVLVLGSSQAKDGVNSELLLQPSLNLASGDQHHDSDFKILRKLYPRFKNLKTVVVEVSYSHFEIPHNGPDFWKNSVYLQFYDINNYNRKTYFKDRLIYLSHPPYFSEKIVEQKVNGHVSAGLNSHGFDTLNFDGQFKHLDYNEKAIAERNIKMNTQPDLYTFQINSKLFEDMIVWMHERDLNVIIMTVPMYKTYLKERNPGILRRRDSVLQHIVQSYSKVRLLDAEGDTLNFNVRDFWNQSHLNPEGAAKFTSILQRELNAH